MKKLFLLLALTAAFGLSACAGSHGTQAAPQQGAQPAHKAVLIVGGQQLPVTLHNAPAANDLYSRLPVTLEFKDFAGMEKISYLD